MTRRPRTFIIGFATACAAVVPFTGASADDLVDGDSNIDPGHDTPTWIEMVLPDAEERELLASDPAFEFVAGGVLVSEPGLLEPTLPSEIAAASLETSDAPVTEAEAFSLHTNPGADQVIFLDFDGHTISNTAWNRNRADEIVVGSYSRESSGNEDETFSQSELNAIVEIWERVAEDFAPWPVDITTEDPGEDALHSSNRTVDSTYGSHVVITHDNAWYGNSGGVAYVGGFGRSFYSPAFVFSNRLNRGSPKSVAEAASHEAGHNLGLSHDGLKDTDPDPAVDNSIGYYTGHGNWAPIMGVGYYKTVTQWSKGEYANASQTQDDVDLIDYHIPGRQTGATGSSGSLGSTDSTTIAALSDGGGDDSYDLDIAEGPASVTLAKTDPNGNLLAELAITNDGTGESTVLEPNDDRNWSHSVTDLDAGSYTLVVRSVGWANPLTNGFSDYASVGHYALSVEVPEPTGTTTTTTTTTTTIPDVTTTVPDVTTTTPTTVTPTTVTPTTTPPTTAPPTSQPDTTTTTVAPSTTTPPTPPTPPTLEPEPDTNLLDAFVPVRLLDTRDATAPSRRLAAGDNVRLAVAGVDGIAADARAAVINVVAVKPAAAGFLSITPCTDVQPVDRTSSLNFVAGSNIANSTIATLTDDGAVCIYASAATDVVVDVTGALGPSGQSGLTDTTTRRLADSRFGDAIVDRLGAGDTAVIDLAGITNFDTTAVAVNITAVRPRGNGFLTVDNCEVIADTAALNFSKGENRGNNGIFALSSDQELCVTTSAEVDVIIDVTGEFGADGFEYVPAEPMRLLDTRSTKSIASGSSTSFDVPDPSDEDLAAAVSVNLASARHPRNGYVTAWDCGAMPESSAFNPVAGQVTANGALLALNDAGRSCLFHDAGGELIVDLNGWWV